MEHITDKIKENRGNRIKRIAESNIMKVYYKQDHQKTYTKKNRTRYLKKSQIMNLKLKERK